MLRMMNDTILVLLRPTPEVQGHGLIEAPRFTPVPTSGLVRKVGPKVHDVRIGDVIAFPPTAGDPIELSGHMHLIVREPEVTAVVERGV